MQNYLYRGVSVLDDKKTKGNFAQKAALRQLRQILANQVYNLVEGMYLGRRQEMLLEHIK